MSTTLSRRSFLKTTSAALATSPFLAHCSGKPKKPNLLFVWTDQQRFDTMAVYGNTVVKAPNLNKLAETSIVFEKAYVSQPVCTPSRSTVMTGLWPHQNGCTANNIPLRQETSCLPQLIDDPDYTTAYMGKWHLGDEIFAQHGFEEWVAIEDGYTKHYRPERDKDERSEYHHFLIEHGYQPDRDNDTFSRGFAAHRPLEHCKPAFLEKSASDFLRQNKDRPFMLYVNFLEPHTPFYGPLNDLHDPERVGLPENAFDPLEENEPLRYKVSREAMQKNYGSKPEQWKKLNAIYHGLVAQVDKAVGGILATLDEMGLRDNTIIVFTSDHGEMMSSHGMFAKQYMYEESARVPWLMSVPGMTEKQEIYHEPVSHIDLVPTLLELMGKPEKAGALPGKSLVSRIAGKESRQQDVFVEWNPNRVHYVERTELATPEEIERIKKEHVRTVVTPDGWKLCLSDTDKHQLFNLEQDPLETTNLYGQPEVQEVVDRLTKKILDWQKQVKDQRTLRI